MEIVTEQIVVTNDMLNNFGFQQAFGKFKQMEFGVKTAYTVSFIANHIERHVKQGRVIFSDLAKSCAKLDEKGNLIPETNPETDMPIPGSFIFKDDEAKEKFEKEQKVFMETEHTIPKNKLSIDMLGDMKMSPNDISALAPLFSDLDD